MNQYFYSDSGVMNKNNKFIFIFYLYIHTSLFFFVFIFIFICFGLGWARPSQPSPVTGPSQWPGWAKSCTREVTSRVLHCAKVIKLPSHSVYKHNMQGMKGERKERTCFGRRRCLQRWWIQYANIINCGETSFLGSPLYC